MGMYIFVGIDIFAEQKTRCGGLSHTVPQSNEISNWIRPSPGRQSDLAPEKRIPCDVM
jgi:hypothetical protein